MDDREEARRRVRRAVQAQMSARRWNKAELVEHAHIDPGTAGDFLDGTRWPQARTLAKIEGALGWPPGRVAALLDGDDAQPGSFTGGGSLNDSGPPALEGQMRVMLGRTVALEEVPDDQLLAELGRRLGQRAGLRVVPSPGDLDVGWAAERVDPPKP